MDKKKEKVLANLLRIRDDLTTSIAVDFPTSVLTEVFIRPGVRALMGEKSIGGGDNPLTEWQARRVSARVGVRVRSMLRRGS